MQTVAPLAAIRVRVTKSGGQNKPGERNTLSQIIKKPLSSRI
jgi:hypothetical protein